ncbi:MAG TPA: hypothetical protein VHA15_14925 [Burkholderiales bacterium]|nr:hypothetical protein [Burkholderiales bacterium]
MIKEYGKLTLDQFQRLVRTLPDIRGQMDELPVLIRTARKERVEEILGKDFHWAAVYELPFIHMIALALMALGRWSKVLETAKADDPQEAALAWMEAVDADDWAGGEGGLFDEQDVVGLVFAMQRNILSIMLYHRTLCTLVQEVRDGSDESLFLAVRVDRSVVACPTFADRIARAELENDKTFFQHLRSALKGPSGKHWLAYRDLRYALHMLRELGFDKLSDAQLEDLLVHKLKLYPNVPSARKNLRKQFTEAKKVATTSKRSFR